ncbi:hypothetical protein V2O64_11655 [Verrucomicrobiaceae bacterium 227]
MSRQKLVAMVAFALIAGSAFAESGIKLLKPDGTQNKAAWMAQGGYGMMVHYLISPKGNTPAEKTADLNRIVDQFDLPFFMAQFDQAGADWLIFTLAQGTGYLSSRNEFIDHLEEGYSPRRDLVSEIGDALHKCGKRLIVYLPGAHTGADPTIKRLLGLGQEGYADRHNDFIRHFSLKLGKRLDGWWFDSCGPQTNEAWQKEIEASKAGNPDSVVAFSGAEFCASGGQLMPRCPIEDYHAGEIHLLEDSKIRTDFVYPPGEGIVINADRKLRKQGQEAVMYLPDSQFIENVQWHGLLPIDLTFNPAIPDQFCHYTDKELFRFVDAVKSVGGALTINVPIGGGSGPAGHEESSWEVVRNGHIPEETLAQLVRLKKHLSVTP